MKRIILAAAAVVACNAAFAVEPGSYVTASVGSAKQKATVEQGSVSDDDTGFQIAGGLRLDNNFGVEVGYTSFGTASVEAAGIEASAKPRSLHVAVTAESNITPEFSVTGKLGVAANRTKVETRMGRITDSANESQTSLVFGVGASYAFTPEVALVAEYHNFGKVAKEEGINLKASLISIGVRYSF